MPAVKRMNAPVKRLDDKIFTLLVSTKFQRKPMYVDRIDHLFEVFWGQELDYKRFGYDTIQEYLQSIPGGLVKREDRTGRLVFDFANARHLNGYLTSAKNSTMPGLLRSESPLAKVDDLSFALVIFNRMNEQLTYLDNFAESFKLTWDMAHPYRDFGFETIEDYINSLNTLRLVDDLQTGRTCIKES